MLDDSFVERLLSLESNYDKLKTVGAVFCSFSPRPTQMVLDLQHPQCQSFGEVSFGKWLIDVFNRMARVLPLTVRLPTRLPQVLP